MTTQTISRPAQRTCANCPYFQDFGEPSGRGWCSAFDQAAREHHGRTAACDQEIEALSKESQQQLAPEPEPEPQPAGLASDEVGSSLQSSQSACPEFEQGRQHGREDAQARLHPIYTKASDGYSTGYLEGYNGVFHPTTQLGQVSAPAQTWSVSYDSKWDWYRAYVGSRCIGHGTTHQEAERLAQKYIATDELIRWQNAAVLAAYSC